MSVIPVKFPNPVLPKTSVYPVCGVFSGLGSVFCLYFVYRIGNARRPLLLPNGKMGPKPAKEHHLPSLPMDRCDMIWKSKAGRGK